MLEIIRKRASETHPDVIFTQDTFADKYLRKIQEEIQNNVPCSEFSLSKVNIQGTDSVSIFVNTRKFEVVNVDREARMVLEQQRRTKLNFLEETRYVVLQATLKISGEKILLSSFHGKNNKASNGLKDELIRDFLIFTDHLAKKLKSEAILIGTDINRDMKSFSNGLPASISVFDFEFLDLCPTQCKRKAKPVIDYFLHSTRLAPICSSARRFHEDETVLDHHPIHTVFQVTFIVKYLLDIKHLIIILIVQYLTYNSILSRSRKACQKELGTKRLSPEQPTSRREISTRWTKET